MKKTLLNILCGLLCAALLIGAVCIGAVRGWQRERAEALSALSADGELSGLLEERAMDAANLIVVVSRHLDASDARLSRLKELRALLSGQISEAEDLVQADAELTALAQELGQSLPTLASVRDSARDQAYISSLTRALSESTDLSEAYNAIVRGFNNRLINSLTGSLARLLGVPLLEAR